VSYARRLTPAFAVFACLAVLATAVAWAQPWQPEKPVEIIVPTAAGGTND
jgi:tripartite-type tricarboxylate transporter receptor subunit TctC